MFYFTLPTLCEASHNTGKTTFASKLAAILDANIVCTDDVAWWADPIHWDDELITGIVKPWLNGENVAYRPSGWVKKNREGWIAVDSGKALIIEGCGACRETLRKYATYTVWMDTEPDIARERVIQRDLASGENGGTLQSVTEFTDWWDSVVDPFLINEEAWKHVNIIVSGTLSDLGGVDGKNDVNMQKITLSCWH
ncbi:MAG: hypothetical protein FWF79_08855 [Defluviitaleaceae bacterium]|nr:hypothetical protein [Defluviitaleaceae bacterium]